MKRERDIRHGFGDRFEKEGGRLLEERVRVKELGDDNDRSRLEDQEREFGEVQAVEFHFDYACEDWHRVCEDDYDFGGVEPALDELLLCDDRNEDEECARKVEDDAYGCA